MKAAFNFLLVTEARAGALFDVLASVGQMNREHVEGARAEFIHKLLSRQMTEYTYTTVDGKRPTLFIEHDYSVRFTENQKRKDSEATDFERNVYHEMLDLFATWNLEESVTLYQMSESEAEQIEDEHFP
jgi:hypothetical protein